ncbi:hypothetical protein Pla22_26360 [Rubripirellula amarantea]|uniref:SGNH hydrolase-type esterase domain-containing protein n=1 Tax=Rubripirellula amarantea TaxID=2527999 RepID=A0A5C5WYL3_9BACT|nr:hypothetical protein [Rubripirellula amarantea]TWT54982.1 hypothetical protein Pla22_26360 [Rubripirellula amarantea]
MLLARWLLGFIAGTLIVAITSPLFVRSYLPRQLNRGVMTLATGHDYRWRSEGYATSSIGPLGMVGKTQRLRAPKIKIALWGDSQAEGTCVADDQKIFALTESLSDDQVEVFPLARSGDSLVDWLTQFPFAEQELDVDAHVILVVELSDLVIEQRMLHSFPKDDAFSRIAETVPAFVIHAARKVLFQPNSLTPRDLRFSFGPVAVPAEPHADTVDTTAFWNDSLLKIQEVASRPVVLIYAPRVPQIMAGRVNVEDPDRESFAELESSIATSDFESGIQLLNVQESQIESGAANRWPHGFDNGQIGSGHLNVVGNSIIAERIVDHFAPDSSRE